VFIVVVVYFVIDSVRKRLDTPSYVILLDLITNYETRAFNFFIPPPLLCFALCLHIVLSTLISESFSPRVKVQVSHPCTATGKIIFPRLKKNIIAAAMKTIASRTHLIAISRVMRRHY